MSGYDWGRQGGPDVRRKPPDITNEFVLPQSTFSPGSAAARANSTLIPRSFPEAVIPHVYGDVSQARIPTFHAPAPAASVGSTPFGATISGRSIVTDITRRLPARPTPPRIGPPSIPPGWRARAVAIWPKGLRQRAIRLADRRKTPGS